VQRPARRGESAAPCVWLCVGPRAGRWSSRVEIPIGFAVAEAKLSGQLALGLNVLLVGVCADLAQLGAAVPEHDGDRGGEVEAVPGGDDDELRTDCGRLPSSGPKT